MCNSSEFKTWHKKEVWKKTGVLDAIERAVNSGMDLRNLRLEVKVDGKWVEVDYNDPLDLVIDPIELTVK